MQLADLAAILSIADDFVVPLIKRRHSREPGTGELGQRVEEQPVNRAPQEVNNRRDGRNGQRRGGQLRIGGGENGNGRIMVMLGVRGHGAALGLEPERCVAAGVSQDPGGRVGGFVALRAYDRGFLGLALCVLGCAKAVTATANVVGHRGARKYTEWTDRTGALDSERLGRVLGGQGA